jgi:flagellar protein FliS
VAPETAVAYRRTAAAYLPPERYPEAALGAVLQYVGRARRAIAERDVLGAHRALMAAQQILGILRGALDFRVGGELARRLDALYAFCQLRLGEANLRKDATPLEIVPEVLTPLQEAFAAAAEACLAGRAPAARR